MKHGAKGNVVNSISLGSCLYTILTTEETILYGRIPFTSLNGFGDNINVNKQSYLHSLRKRNKLSTINTCLENYNA